MCGIAGFVNARGDAEGPVLQAMLRRIAHRGPDGQGVFLEGRAALGHRRLAIIDLEGGPQPMFNEDGRFVVVFNGEIYNYQALTEELVAAGHTFATRSDTEVLLHGWEAWGRDLLPRLRGMFAFALWDRKTGTLFCARDPFGIKPLYYYQAADGTLLFASEIKAFLDHPAFEKRLNESQLELYLSFQYSPGEETFFRGVKKLLPAHCLTLDSSGLRVERWWQAEFTPELSPTDWAAAIDDTMQGSVAAHKIADVEVAGFLSGGVDSAYITALARPTRCYTIGYAEAGYDEADQAAHLARVLGIQSRVRRITPEEFWNAIPAVQYHMDEPLADAAAVALYFLNGEAAKDVKVCLSGEGADEFFAGYNIYKEPFTATWYDRLPAGLRRVLGAVAERLPAVPGVNFLVRRARPLAQRYYGNTALFTERQKRRLLRHDYRAALPFDLARPYWQASAGLDPVTRMQWCDLHLWLAGDILLKADKMSMAHSLELRVPFLDREVFALARRLPPDAKADARQTKKALRAAAARHLPLPSAERKKRGFPVPVRDWLRDPVYAARVRAAFDSPAAARFFQVRQLHILLDRHLRRRQDNWRQIFCIYCFLVWYEQFFGSDAA
ncbi:asparagine synthase (glutamine-hydrolyzing) [Subdoligranulum variabile]|uniref:asparagine synthase (glutamine-hydrolyzing) n=1 Tax=Subdoligranulum variabile DSM 15176 TaxID=411471 RepID=D1PIW6_9FIRM|nr:asparagine synthase (glutamine-hydrolyzing) [Subdoligranulum variabile]EFB77475.1 asparagine synthase (glutamine-hydrolyzing) [Subdoligranulum variabile DSM 15176]UWP67359.1 asparagine synthase (glutamine-hydrolyzing) [Subdoligranulum variabile]